MLTPVEIDLIQSCRTRLSSPANDIGDEFYQRFFRHAPDLQTLFARHTKDQAEKLVEVLSIAVAAASHLEDLREPMRKLGHQHAQMGLNPQHFKLFGEALLMTLAHHVRDWSAQDHQAWSKLYKFLTHHMRQGMAMS
jgi:hemoglobin-like flavoprotein